jgi:hypothetical protein
MQEEREGLSMRMSIDMRIRVLSLNTSIKVLVEKKRYDNQVGILTLPASSVYLEIGHIGNNDGKYSLYASIF